MSPRSERAEMHLAILRGVAMIRALEIAHQNEAQQLLEAKQELVSLIDDDDESGWAPLPLEIEAACAEINACWSDEERERRWHFEPPSYAEGQRARYLRWRDKHRDEILAKGREKRRDPAWRAKQKEYDRRWRERNVARVKEQAAARRDKYNAARKARRQKNHDQFLAKAREYRELNRERLNASNCERRRAKRAAARQLVATA